jgi:hypothetical protein
VILKKVEELGVAVATKTIQINYDLRKPGRDYQPVYDYIKSFGYWARPLASLWLVRTAKSASTVRDELNRLVDANDEVAIFDVTGDAWATNFSDAHVEWMYQYMSAAGGRRAA